MTRLGSRLVPSLMVHDVEASLAFYSAVLGFDVCGRHEDGQGLAWAEVRRDAIVLQFMRGPICGLPEAPVLTGTLYFFPESVDAIAEQVAGQAEVAWGPELMPYGMRELAIRDPDGYLLAFSEPAAEAEAPVSEAELARETEAEREDRRS